MRILIIDDDEAEANAAASALHAGLPVPAEVVCVGTLGQAIRALLERAFDLMVVEPQVQRIHTNVTISGLHSTAPGVPIVVHGRALTDDTALQALRSGAQECVNKHATGSGDLVRAARFAMERQQQLGSVEAARLHADHRATHDPLTGLANRELFLEQLQRTIAHAERHGRKAALLFVDLDGFKEINDTHGHAHGDVLLQAVAGRLQECVRRSDTIARLGGDEFVILLSEVTGRRDPLHVREAIRSQLRAPIALGDELRVSVFASVGGAIFPRDGRTARQLLEAADAEMYRDKARNHLRRSRPRSDPAQATLFDGVGEREELRRRGPAAGGGTALRITPQRLLAAFDAEEFELHYQPILHASTRELFGIESLLRWRSPERGLLGPVEFLPIAEDAGLAPALSAWAVQTAAHAAARWHTVLPEQGIRVSVHLSGSQLLDPGLPTIIDAAVTQAGAPSDRLAVELAADGSWLDAPEALEILEAIRAMGVSVVLDNFGVAQDAIRLIHEIPVCSIKIDRRYIGRVESSPRTTALITAVIAFAQELQLPVVAEGVETPEQSQRLIAMGCVLQQGTFFAPPMAAADAERTWPALWGAASH